jgi:hypothetical protein
MNGSCKRLVLFLLVLFGIQQVSSQSKVDFISLNYSSIGKSDFKDKQGETSLQHIDFSVFTPTIKWGAKAKFNSVLNYRHTSYSYDDVLLGVNWPTSFQEIKYTLLARFALSNYWELLCIPRLSIRSDFKSNLSQDDLFPSFAAVAIKTSRSNDKMKWGLGLGYNNDLGKNSVIPILSLNYTNDAMRLNVFFPTHANLIFTSAPKIEYGFGFTTDAALVHINTSDEVEYLRTLNVHFNPILSYNVVSNFWVHFKAGAILRRQYDLYNSDFETPTPQFENKLKPAGFVQVGVSLRTKS